MSQLQWRRNTSSRASRKLRGNDRIARHARNIVWKRVIAFLKRAWLPLALFLILPTALMVLIPFKTSGTARWILVGVMGATGFWLDVIMVILWSGIASTVMGIEGETQTAEVLDNFAGEEWSLINGLRFNGKGDIDHILIGPAGLLVFESKWSGDRWPMELRPTGYLGRQLRWAIKQVKMNRDELVREFKNVIGDIPIYLICVLWSGEQSNNDDRYFFRESVYGIRGSELANWLAGLPKNIVSESVIKAVAAPIESFAHLRDQDDVLSDGPFRPTLDRWLVGSLILPLAGIFIPAFVLAYVAKLNQDTLIFVAMGILLLLGLLIRVILKMKALAYAWLLGLAAVCLYILVYMNHWVTR